jgi:hypothetical protein
MGCRNNVRALVFFGIVYQGTGTNFPAINNYSANSIFYIFPFFALPAINIDIARTSSFTQWATVAEF